VEKQKEVEELKRPDSQFLANTNWIPSTIGRNDKSNEKKGRSRGAHKGRSGTNDSGKSGTDKDGSDGGTLTDSIKTIDLICGGFPCQPFSRAGQRKGKEDDRHLWPEYFRLIQEIKPRLVIGENVAGLINLGLDEVLSDLESASYTWETFIIPACAVNAPHRRDRVWIIAYTDSIQFNDDRGGYDTGSVCGERPDRIMSNHGIDGQAKITDIVGGTLNPTWVEWLMGFPEGWTDLSS